MALFYRGASLVTYESALCACCACFPPLHRAEELPSGFFSPAANAHNAWLTPQTVTSHFVRLLSLPQRHVCFVNVPFSSRTALCCLRTASQDSHCTWHHHPCKHSIFREAGKSHDISSSCAEGYLHREEWRKAGCTPWRFLSLNKQR